MLSSHGAQVAHDHSSRVPVPEIFQSHSRTHWGDATGVAAAPRPMESVSLKGAGYAQPRTNTRDSPRTVWLRLLSAMAEEYPERMLVLPAAIGRVSDSRIQPSAKNGLFSSTYLSRNHALIRMDAGRVVIEDLGSCNGTFVNGQQVLPGSAVVLSDRDIIQFGSEDLAAPGMAHFGSSLHADTYVLVQILFSAPPHGSHLEPVADWRQQSSGQAFHSAQASTFASNALYAKPLGEQVDSRNAPGTGLRPRTSADPFSWMDVGGVLSSDPASKKISAITKALNSMSAALRGGAASGAEQMPVLEAVAELLQQHLEEQHGDGASNDTLHDVLSRPAPTVRQRPNTLAALRVVEVYEFVFCVAAFLLVAYIMW